MQLELTEAELERFNRGGESPVSATSAAPAGSWAPAVDARHDLQHNFHVDWYAHDATITLKLHAAGVRPEAERSGLAMSRAEVRNRIERRLLDLDESRRF